MSRALSPPARVLVRLPSWLGDFVMAEPVARALFESHARASCADRVTFAAPGRLLALLDGRFEGARRLPIETDRPESARDWRGHDVALLLNGSWRSAWTALRARVPERVGFARGARGPLLSVATTPARERGRTPLGSGIHGRWPRVLPRPFGSACVELAQLHGLSVRDRRPRLVPDPHAFGAARARLTRAGVDPDQAFVLVHAGGRADSAKAFPSAGWRAAFERHASLSSWPIVVACAPGEEANARGAASDRARVLLLDDPAPDLAACVALTALARVVAGTDSGPRHVARALGKPYAVVVGPTDPRHTAEHDAGVRVLRVETACGPCHREVCPLAGAERHACMTRIDPGAVSAAILELEHGTI